jgi:hypothetical protein
VIVLIWPFHIRLRNGRASPARLDSIAGQSAGDSARLGYSLALRGCYFRNFTDEEEPYVYVQTLPDIAKLLDPLHALTTRDPQNFFITGNIVTVDHHRSSGCSVIIPMFTRSRWTRAGDLDGAFLLIDESKLERAEESLTQNLFQGNHGARAQRQRVEHSLSQHAEFGFYSRDANPISSPTLR